ncbi:hypothetical protein SAMN05660766_2968 [Curtobacterium sp. 314Chir4.1]|uniref:hypothetical protein n=1 Tax=Curtobacterium sp. 314Chir4.1 TaxID=1279028 RepID=UPI000BC89DB5|nr:hypothetical protein [Curtobacterium sp. 314Chir4.1]SOC89247.1 hypothetical protein SAMN05660766_2968 [Curtobacterium sp. 314Chir4.1]
MAKHRHRCGERRTSVLVLEVLGLATAIVTLVAAILQLLEVRGVVVPNGRDHPVLPSPVRRSR